MLNAGPGDTILDYMMDILMCHPVLYPRYYYIKRPIIGFG